MALACGPLAVALLTEGRWAGEDSRVVALLALGLALATGAVLLLRAGAAREAREAAAPERALRQARDQQAATAEILAAMAASPPDLQRVLDTIARNAARVCDGLYAVVLRVAGAEIRLAAHHGLSPARLDALNQRYPRRLDDGSLVARAIRDASVVHCPDIPHDPRVPSWLRELAQAEGFRSLVVVPMVGDGRTIGTLNVSRPEGAFTERQIQFLRIFADQAVIAIENVRLFQELQARNRELTESLEQQTATAEILGVISRSPTDTQPVFDGIVASAVRLCDARIGAIYRIENDVIDVVATADHSDEAHRTHVTAYPRPLSDLQLPFQRAISTAAPVHVADIDGDFEFSDTFKERARTLGYRSALIVPMRREGRVIGLINVGRIGDGGVSRPFSEREIGLLQVFAGQAVIAIENVRLFRELEARNRELTESLEQQTATGAILRVISGSPTHIQPVLDAVAESATRLCEARDVTIALVDQHVLRVVASHGPLARWWPDEGIPIGRGSVTGRAVVERRTIHIHDLASESELEYPEGKVYQRQGGHRTNMAVPLLREGVAIGVIAVRREEVRPFTNRQVGLLETFADQAVIAIENVRLFQELEARNRDLTESLEQQTATAEILGVISRSPTDLDPVLDAVARNASRLCGAANVSLYRVEGSLMHKVAEQGLALTTLDVGETRAITRTTISGRVITDRATIHVPDYQSADMAREYPDVRRDTGIRTTIGIPLLREGAAIGAFTAYRTESRPFSQREIALLQTFADQAVIAIENVRLFRELQARNRELTEALEQQTATSEILQVISSSPTGVEPVFEAIARSATALCEADLSGLYTFDGELIHLEASHGRTPEEIDAVRRAFPQRPGRGSVTARAILEAAAVQVPDHSQDPEVADALRTYRTVLAVPMTRDGRPIGAISVARRVVRPFTDKQIALLKIFADQAVIAIDNVRLFTELEVRNRELTESLEQQTATAEILHVISRSPTDVQPVFDSILDRAIRLADGLFGAAFSFDGELVHLVAHHGLSDEALALNRRVYPMAPGPGQLTALAVLEKRVVHLRDVDTDTDVPEMTRQLGRVIGFRSLLAVPMLREDRAVGVLTITRAAGEFSPRHIELVKTFADQAVIAIENVRLFQELEARTRELARSVEELQALSEVGRAVSSTLDLPTVLATIVTRAVQLSGTSSGVLYEYDEATQTFHLQASHQTETEVVEALRASPIQLGEGATGRAVVRRGPVEVVDLVEDQQFKPVLRTILTRLGYRSILSIPLLLEQRILGALTVSRREPGSFPPETVSLLQTFATQSALAIQNARLFREIEAKSRELEVASRHKSQFLANMSHELRTPLNAILGYSELMVDGIYGDLPTKAADVMARIDRSGKHLLGLINDVLDLSKIEAGQLELGLADYSLAEVVHAVVTQVESLAAEKGLILQATVAPDLPAGRGDERRLAQVLLNLVGNALKFTEVGSVRIVAHRDDDTFVVSVADSGPGIAEADRQRIFEEFQQADSSSTRKKGGTGLGLSIAKRIIELHGGRIWVESTVGRGSVFSFRVPVRVERQAARA